MMRESTDKGCYVSQTHALRQRCRPMEQGRMAAMPQAPSAEVKLPRTPRCSAIQRSGPLGLCPGAWHQSSAERSPRGVYDAPLFGFQRPDQVRHRRPTSRHERGCPQHVPQHVGHLVHHALAEEVVVDERIGALAADRTGNVREAGARHEARKGRCLARVHHEQQLTVAALQLHRLNHAFDV